MIQIWTESDNGYDLESSTSTELRLLLLDRFLVEYFINLLLTYERNICLQLYIVMCEDQNISVQIGSKN